MLEKFSVLELLNTRSASLVTIQKNTLKFNSQTAAELGNPPYIQFLVNQKAKQFAIRPCKEDAPHCVPFCKSETIRRSPIRITSVAVAGAIRKIMGWQLNEAWNIPAVLLPDEDALVYDLTTATPPKRRSQLNKEMGADLEDEEVGEEELN